MSIAPTSMPEWKVWWSMNHRCSNPKSKSWKNYGGRGISVCNRWSQSFQNFLSDMGERPSSEHSLDRINNDGNYEPSNCRWATLVEQRNNTRQNRMITAFGKTQNATRWSKELGIGLNLIYKRLAAGVSPEDLLTVPSQRPLSKGK